MEQDVSLKEVKDELNQIRKRNPALKDDSAFVLWFLQSYLVDSEETAKKALTGVCGDKNIDAIFIDEKVKQANIIQGKFHYAEGYREKRNDVLAFADLSLKPWGGSSELEVFYNRLDPLVRQKFEELVGRVRRNKYVLRLFYVTTGTCSPQIISEANERVRQSNGPSEIYIIDYDRVLTIFKDYLEGVAPAVPLLNLKIVSEGAIYHEGMLHRHDPERGIDSWVFSMSGKDIGELYDKVGIRLFARNIRGYAGDTDVNKSIARTIKNEPHNFWYYNNGLTIVCDGVKHEEQGREKVLVVENAQVINGQQTTRTLHKTQSRSTNILVKVIKIPRNKGNGQEYDTLVNSIVQATNWQNHIEPSDLVSNEHIQVLLERELRKVGYQYIRKRMHKSEAKRLFGQGFYQVDKREIAQVVAACEFNPYVVRKVGKEGLFERPYYASIFRSTLISYYLSKYRLMKEVSYAARGYPERAYAKWLVLRFLWDQLSADIGSGNAELRFRYACERENYRVTIPLNSAAIDVFRAALKFYRQKRGKGEKAKDVSSFFNLKDTHENFVSFWNSPKNKYKRRVRNNIKKFRDALEKLDME